MWTSGTITAAIFLPLGFILLVVAIILLVVGIREQFETQSSYGMEGEGKTLAGGICGAVGLFMFVLPLIGLSLVSFNTEYMAYKPVSGQVQDVASRQIADGKAMSTRYVVKIDGQPYGIDDTRAALIKTGDTVNLNCVREFVWGSTNNGYACNWGA